MTSSYHNIDVPFDYRHTCWFCGEPYFDSHAFMAVPNYDNQTLPIMLPCCQECFSFANGLKVSSLDLLRDKVKQQLHKKYHKHLQIGVNWTKEELESSEMDGKALEGFRISGWKMFEIAKERVNYSGWPIYIDGLPCYDVTTTFQFEYDGIIYTSLNHAVTQLAALYAIPQPYLEQVIELVGREKMTYALRFCKITYGYSPAERESSLASLRALLAEEQANALASQHSTTAQRDIALADIKELMLYRTMISPHAIHWALSRGIQTLAELAEYEEVFFEHFGKESELTAFTYFNGLQIYFEKRELEPLWAQNDDPNRALFQ
ncbi:hypothetical protein [Photobacterium aquimaris]|uniref:Uncharacterized protein n=1 Tax=Photobacterium aquimaris TaxID=512643 RepID=A0A2T3HZ94_9GAMM|nr:hypothetical protein [Photobacterium aquimaris]OBU14616.1 hypothetical protein AYY21_06360 [Photobacterium aquimaris]PQJ41030.1 hypothetical protein BTN98_05100 [Photobacterium aquimaris]PSU06484.1 hypothetical protein C0W81_07105 [Photobacterium aquimaris]